MKIYFKIICHSNPLELLQHFRNWRGLLDILLLKITVFLNNVIINKTKVLLPQAYVIGGARVAQWVRSLDLTAHTSLSPIQRGFAPGFVNYKKGCTRLAAASDKVYQLLTHGRWFSPGTPTSSTTKTGHHDIAEILLKVALNTKNQSYVIGDLKRFWISRIVPLDF